MIRRFFEVLKFSLTYIYHNSFSKSHESVNVVYDAVNRLGGIYIKLIQFVCLRTDVFAKKDRIRFLSFYDEVPYETIDVNDILSRELGEEKRKGFSEIDTVPFACGTFGQVYRGKLTDGTDIVVKLLRPHLHFKLAFDLIVIKLAAFVFNLLYYQRIMNIYAVIKEFEVLTYKELDYRQEGVNAQYFYEYYRNHPYVVIPKTFLDLTTTRVLVQEYIGGISVTSVIRDTYEKGQESSWQQDEGLSSLHDVIQVIAYELGIQAFTCDIFYADPHPGNIKFLPDGKFAFIDFGIVGSPPTNRKNYYNILELLVARAQDFNTQQMGEVFLTWGAEHFMQDVRLVDQYLIKKDNSLRSMVTEKYAQILDSHREQFRYIEETEQENFTKIYMEIVRAGELLGVQIPAGFLASMRTVGIYKSWVSFLDPNFHFMRDTYRKILKYVNKATLYNEDELKIEKVHIEDTIERLFDWVGNIAEKDLLWYELVSDQIRNIYA